MYRKWFSFVIDVINLTLVVLIIYNYDRLFETCYIISDKLITLLFKLIIKYFRIKIESIDK